MVPELSSGWELPRKGRAREGALPLSWRTVDGTEDEGWSCTDCRSPAPALACLPRCTPGERHRAPSLATRNGLRLRLSRHGLEKDQTGFFRDQGLEAHNAEGRIHVARKPCQHDKWGPRIEPYDPYGPGTTDEKSDTSQPAA